MPTTRRQFLKTTVGSSALVSLAPAMPNFLFASAAAAAESKGDNVLVVVQLTGGNDGLNTVIPYADDVYHQNRFQTHVARGQALKLDDYVGLHPAMTDLHGLLDQHQLSVIQGVGYPNPNRSHFESMDIWHTCQRPTLNETNATRGGRTTGWLGRFLDAAPRTDGRDIPALHLGAERQPLALTADRVRVPSAQSLEGFKLQDGGDARIRRAIEAVAAANRPADDELVNFLQRSTVSALASSQEVQEALKNYTTPVNYPGTGLGQKMRTIAQLIEAGLSTRIYYVSLNGFDTHSNQNQAHATLLRELSGAIAAFTKDMAHHGHDKRVLVMTFSEFGRRVRENASGGTDHGAAAPMILAGGRVKPGPVGKHPNMTDLDQGDLKFHTDFRQVYAAVLEQWLECKDSAKVLGEKFEPAPVIA
jgi:uncharacterized protein (DUF1501 family)